MTREGAPREAPRVVRLDVVDSTQRAARALLEDGAAHGSVAIAREQTAGRGRLGRTWHNAGVGLYASWVLRPASLPMTKAPRLTLAAALAVLDALDALGARGLAVKWPNDVVVLASPAQATTPYRKLAGVLVEAVHMRPARGGAEAALDGAVLGIGVNVRAPIGGFDASIAQSAVALQDVATVVGTGARDSDVDVVFGAIVRALSARIDDVARDEAWRDVLDAARRRSATLGRRVQVDGIAGTATDIDDDGELLVRGDDGVTHAVRAGDVHIA